MPRLFQTDHQFESHRALEYVNGRRKTLPTASDLKEYPKITTAVAQQLMATIYPHAECRIETPLDPERFTVWTGSAEYD